MQLRFCLELGAIILRQNMSVYRILEEKTLSSTTVYIYYFNLIYCIIIILFL
jgi:hypothetical protein